MAFGPSEPALATIRSATPAEAARDAVYRFLGIVAGLAVVIFVFAPAVVAPLATAVWSYGWLASRVEGWAGPLAFVCGLAVLVVMVLMLSNRRGPRQVCVVLLTLFWVGGAYLAATTAGYDFKAPPPLHPPGPIGWACLVLFSVIYLGVYALMFKDE